MLLPVSDVYRASCTATGTAPPLPPGSAAGKPRTKRRLHGNAPLGNVRGTLLDVYVNVNFASAETYKQMFTMGAKATSL